MATNQVKGRVFATPDNLSDSGYSIVRAWRDGTLSFAQFADSMAAAGRVFTANFGTVATQLTFLTQAANRPDAFVRVPTGTVIMPLKCDIAFGAMAGTVTTIDMRICANDIGNGTSSAASVGPVNMRTDNPGAGGGAAGLCTVRQLATADTTAETTPISIFKHVYTQADGASVGDLNRHITRDLMGSPVVIGAGTWETFIWATSTQATGYAIKTWIEMPSTWWV